MAKNMAKTGIEPRVEFLATLISRIMPNVGKAFLKWYRLRVALDGGEEQVFLVHERPVLKCEPGVHRVTVALGGAIYGRYSFYRLLTRRTLKVEVEPGRITEVCLRVGFFPKLIE